MKIIAIPGSEDELLLDGSSEVHYQHGKEVVPFCRYQDIVSLMQSLPQADSLAEGAILYSHHNSQVRRQGGDIVLIHEQCRWPVSSLAQVAPISLALADCHFAGEPPG